MFTIVEHCNGLVTYSPSIASKIQKYKVTKETRSRHTEDEWLTMRQAALLLPLNPKRNAIYKHIRRGDIKTRKIAGVHATRLDWIDDHIAKRFGDIPEGVSILHNDLDLCLLDDPPESFFESLPAFRIQQRKASRLFDVNKACTEHGLRIEIPAIVHSRVARALTYGARFVLIHEGMFA